MLDLQMNKNNNDCWTTRQDCYYDAPEGDLIFDSEMGLVVERTEAGIRIKEKFPKTQNWHNMADELGYEIRWFTHWMQELKMKQGYTNFSQIPTRERKPKNDETATPGTAPTPYLYFHDEKNWVMYEGDTDYLFLFEVSRENRYLGSLNEMDCLSFAPQDCLTDLLAFLNSWFERVNGYPKENFIKYLTNINK